MEAVPLAVAVQAHIEDRVPLSAHWRRFTSEQRALADALDLELVRLMRKVGADDYFGALGLPPTSKFLRISAAANFISKQFSEERVRAFGLHRKQGGWIFKARRIDALVRQARDALQQIQQAGGLDAYVARCRSQLLKPTLHPGTPPEHIADDQGERSPNRKETP